MEKLWNRFERTMDKACLWVLVIAGLYFTGQVIRFLIK